MDSGFLRRRTPDRGAWRAGGLASMCTCGGGGVKPDNDSSWLSPLYPILSFSCRCFKKLAKQQCIPVGCILPAYWPYPIVSHVFGGGLPNHPGCRPSLEADPPGCRPSFRQTLWIQTPGGRSPSPDEDNPGGRPSLDADPSSHVTIDACWEANPLPRPPMDRRNDTRLWKYYLTACGR